ncbi:hypothetical protein HY948_02645 [Candidatus Gottesmanbacteria bacterium]|nr:hypothetical protein [Candidatus Gottesmanbacteria bacterium]
MKKIFWILSIIIIAVITFWDFSGMYFQQDEWHSFGFILSEGIKYITLDHSLLTLLINDRVGARAIMYALFSLVGLSSVWYAALAFVLHSINTFLVGIIAYAVTKRKTVAWLASLLFFTNSVSHQAYSWFGTFAGSAVSVLFVLLSVYAYIKFMARNNPLLKHLSLLFLWISFFFKETGLFLFGFYPLWYFFAKNRKFSTTIWENILFLVYGVIIVMVRLQELFAPAGEANVLITARNGFSGLLANTLLYPISAVSQLFIPSQILYAWTNQLVSLFFSGIESGSTAFDLASQVTMGNALSVVLSCITFIGALAWIKRAKGNMRGIIIGSLLFLSLSFLPYIVIRKGEAYLEPRYYYAGAAAAALLGAMMLGSFIASKKVFYRLMGIIIVFLLIGVHMRIIRQDLAFQKDVGEERRRIISTITASAPKLPEKIVFYVTGDTRYYGLEELAVPFQSGLGQVLLLHYSMNGQIDPKFFHDGSFLTTQDQGFLYDTVAQGYKEKNGRGFGYFWSERELAAAVKTFNIPKASVYAWQYHGENHILEDITQTTRKNLSVSP